MKLSDREEEILEKIWIYTVEKNKEAVASDFIDSESLELLLQKELLKKVDNKIVFTDVGIIEGKNTIRRHRLAEHLTMNVLDIKDEGTEDKACEFEHLLKEGVDSKVCTMLNHPTTCPHGKPIPSGDCCAEAAEIKEVGVIPLTECKVNKEGEIAYIQTKDSKKMQKLMAMGIIPGNKVVLKQAFPAYIFKIGFSEFAVDRSLAEEIFIRGH